MLGEFVSVPLSDNRILQPVFRTLRENTSVVVWDGATVVIGGLIEDRNTTMEDKVPFFGNVPVIGKFFKSKGNDRIKRAVIFFVKVNIIDPVKLGPTCQVHLLLFVFDALYLFVSARKGMPMIQM